MTDQVAAPVAAPAAPVAAAPTPAPVTLPAAAPAAAPTAAPAADPTPAPLSLDPPAPPPTPAVQEGVVVEYTPTGDPGLDLALSFVGQRGFGPEHPGIVAAQKGDFKPLEDALKVLGDKAKGYERYLTAAKQSYEVATAKSKAASEATTKSVVEAVGGVANWNQVQAWAAANADPHEKDAINAAFKAGGIAAVSTAKELFAMWKASGAANVPPKQVAKDTASPSSTSVTPLDPKAYGREFYLLQQKLGRRTEGSPELAALNARRAAYRAPN